MRGLIVSAGKNTRFGADKALQKIKGVENIVRLHDLMKPHVSDVYISIREERLPAYKKILPQANYILLDKSEGCGQAIRDSFKQLPEDFYVITWGDSIYRDMDFLSQSFDQNRFNVFVRAEADTYVGYEINDNDDIVKVRFYKDEPTQPSWCWRDKFTFLGQKSLLQPYLERLTPDKFGEHHLLFVVDEMYKDGVPAKAIKITDTGMFSFNTREDLDAILKQL